jgi:TRAP-type C4-dicarboxylate transport system substrate-binding protein
MDMVLQAAGATTLSIPSNELYAAMQTGACDAGITSSTSLISFRLEEIAKSLTTGRGKSYWYMLEPVIMSKQVFDSLAEGSAGRDHGARSRSREVRHRGSDGGRQEGG